MPYIETIFFVEERVILSRSEQLQNIINTVMKKSKKVAPRSIFATTQAPLPKNDPDRSWNMDTIGILRQKIRENLIVQ